MCIVLYGSKEISREHRTRSVAPDCGVTMAGPLSIRKVLVSSVVLLASQCVTAQGEVQEPFLGEGDGDGNGDGCHNAVRFPLLLVHSIPFVCNTPSQPH